MPVLYFHTFSYLQLRSTIFTSQQLNFWAPYELLLIWKWGNENPHSNLASQNIAQCKPPSEWWIPLFNKTSKWNKIIFLYTASWAVKSKIVSSDFETTSSFYLVILIPPLSSKPINSDSIRFHKNLVDNIE